MSKPVNATIVIDDPRAHAYKAVEQSNTMPRASYTSVHEDKKTSYTFEADDPTALRAAINAVLKQIIICQQMERIQDGSDGKTATN